MLARQLIEGNLTAQYGVDVFEMQEGAIPAGSNVVVVDDLIATGGSAVAAHQLVEQAGAKVIQNLFVVEVRPLA